MRDYSDITNFEELVEREHDSTATRRKNGDQEK